jgi:DNA-binding MarR family transcriptional regulator
MSDFALGARIAAVYELHAQLLEPTLRAMGISWASFQLLAAAHSAGGSGSQAELARRLGLSPATLCEAVQAHVSKGLLVIEKSPHDARVRLVRLTPRGQEIMRKVQAALDEIAARMLKGVPKAEAQAAQQVLDRIVRNLESHRNGRG